MTASHYVIEGINPEPWTAPEVSVIRRGGKFVPQVYKKAQLRSYQEAVAEALRRNYPDVQSLDEPVALTFFLWRQLADYEGTKGRVRRHGADATNMQKALEDALQGILITNDRHVRDVRTVIIDEGPEVAPIIAIRIEPVRVAHHAVVWIGGELARIRAQAAAALTPASPTFDVGEVF